MGTTGSVVRHRCAYNCSDGGGTSCGSSDGYEGWLAEELHRAMDAQDTTRVEELLSVAPQLKERELNFPGEPAALTALALALNRRDTKVTLALLKAGVSPNLPISEQQRSVYAQRSQLAAINGGDPDLQNLVPSSHFEALCAVAHKELFVLLLEHGANPNSGMIQVCHCGDIDMLNALLSRGADPNGWQRASTPLVTAVKSKIHPYEKVVTLLRISADPNFTGPATGQSTTVYPPLILATRKRDYKMVRALLEAAGDVNQGVGDEGLPNALFWATYWGELELVKLFVTLSRHRLDLNVKKYTGETVFDVAQTSRSYADLRKPKHIAKLPLPSRPAVVYEKIHQMLEQYRAEHPEPIGSLATGSTTATRDQNSLSFSRSTSVMEGSPSTGHRAGSAVRTEPRVEEETK